MCEQREMTRGERAAIKKLVVTMCANYDRDYGCLPLDCPCYMLGKWYTGAYCKYFREAVLPLDAALMHSLTKGGSADYITCPICEGRFAPNGRQKYCSDACRAAGERLLNRDRKRKQRRNRTRPVPD